MDFFVKSNPSDADIRFSKRANENGVLLLDIEIQFPEAQIPKPIKIAWHLPCRDIYSTWGANLGFKRLIGVNWSKRVSRSRLACGAPYHSLISFDGKNRMTVAVSDAKTPIEIATGVCEETAEMDCELRFFTEQVNRLSAYHATVYIDTREIPYEQALKEADRYLADACGYPSAYIPDVAKRPMYSCWYSFHQNIDTDAIVKQCKLAKELGMEAVIVDDGWQTDDSGRGYAYCGDWEVCERKIPDMKRFVEEVHQCGMKFILWYSVPFVGIYSKVYASFSDMFLDGPQNETGRKWAILDPRYPEVRKYLTDIYVQAKKNWNPDGFKLDFIDSFQLFPQTKTYDPRWDTLSLEDGVDRLLAEITTALRALDPEILIEFRQGYFGPAIRKYGNMIRVQDCPNDSLANHVYAADMKFVMDRTPIHSDMLMWNVEDSVESAAHQVLGSLFSVPQISVLLDQIPKNHAQMLRFWLRYWNENREILLDGDFFAVSPEHLYVTVGASQNGRIIAVAHANVAVSIDKPFDRLDFINATGEEILILYTKAALGEKRYRVIDCMGNEIDSGVVTLSKGAHCFDVPKCGMVHLE